jgi:hypothetical protein
MTAEIVSPHLWQNAQSFEARRAKSQMLADLWCGRGLLHLDLRHGIDKFGSAAAAHRICRQLGQPLQVSGRTPWYPLSVRLDAHPSRSHGIGPNPVHVDLLTRTRPPPILALFCVRPDPNGGGATELSDLVTASLRVGKRAFAELRRAVFSYWTDKDVINCGVSLKRFPVLPYRMGGEPIRFTMKMRPYLLSRGLPSASTKALRDFEAAVGEQLFSIRLKPGELLVLRQHRWAHGRAALGPGQSDLPPAARRLLLQAYINPNARLVPQSRRGGCHC